MFPGNYWFKWILGVTFRFKTAVSGLSLIYPGDLAESRSRTTRAEQLRQISIFTSTIMVSIVQLKILVLSVKPQEREWNKQKKLKGSLPSARMPSYFVIYKTVSFNTLYRQPCFNSIVVFLCLVNYVWLVFHQIAERLGQHWLFLLQNSIWWSELSRQ